MNKFDLLFSGFETLPVVVVGDIMLDTYQWGNVERISPEAPVPILSHTHTEYRIGGAGNVALNTVALGASTTLFSVIGKDATGDMLLKILEKENIQTQHIIRSSGRPTTNKIRIMSRNQQMMRIDEEIKDDIDADLENEFIENFKSFITSNNIAVVIFEDYNKGVLTKNCIGEMLTFCNEKKILTAVDPKHKNFFEYKHTGIFKPNLKEVKEALHILEEKMDIHSFQKVHDQLQKIISNKISLITLSEKGIFAQSDQGSEIIPSYNRDIADVSGAGDTVIAVASLVYAVSGDMMLAAKIANIAGGLVCEEAGTVAISKKRLQEECLRLL
ncbi:MAG: carbohydrate kinase [Bacteroidetes bacterium]|nr:carbohydrate kinase [Bacteroidota bacterium]